MKTVVTEILPSYYFPALIIITKCGHKHARPEAFAPEVGDSFDCPYLHEDIPEAAE